MPKPPKSVAVKYLATSDFVATRSLLRVRRAECRRRDEQLSFVAIDRPQVNSKPSTDVIMLDYSRREVIGFARFSGEIGQCPAWNIVYGLIATPCINDGRRD